jgi:putative signal transducing protein
MTDIDHIWHDKSDDELIEAADNLSDFTEEAERVIREELRRRGLPEPQPEPPPVEPEDTRCVFVASGFTEASQIISFLESAGIPSALRGESTTKTHGITVDGLGKLEVLVTEANEQRARELLESAEGGEFRLGEDEDVEPPQE